MIDFPIAKVPLIMSVLALLWVFISIALILLVLLQKGRGGGIGAAFGGAGAGSLLGTKTGDFLTWVTIALVVLFLFLGVVMAKFYRDKPDESLKAPTQPAQNQTMPSQGGNPIGQE